MGNMVQGASGIDACLLKFTKTIAEILRERQRYETLHIYSFHINLTFSGINNAQQPRPPPAST